MFLQFVGLIFVSQLGCADDNEQAIPGDFVASGVDCSSIHVSWKKPNPPTKFRDEYHLTIYGRSYVKGYKLRETSKTITGLEPYTISCLAVKAVWANGTVVSHGASTFLENVPPEQAIPGDFVASGVDCSSIHVSWKKPNPPTKFRDEYHLTIYGRSYVKGYKLRETSKTITGLEPYTISCLAVKAVWANGTVVSHGASTFLENVPPVLYGQEDSVLYKIVNLRPKGFNEVRLYEEVFSSDCPPSVLGLKKFLPAYRGLFYNPITSRFFIGMEDILKDMEHPSACDIKIGRTSYLPGDSEEKISTEKTKYLWREKIGFFITGMNVYDSETGFNAFYDISYGRCLEPSNVFEKGVCVFLGRDPRRRTLLAHAFLPHLSQLAAWFESQTQYHFCASSLLLAYDCLPEDASSASTPSSHAHTATPALKVHVRLIDFARWRHVDDGQYDTNFLYGLHRLMHYMRKAAFREPTGGQSHTASASSSNTGLTATSCSLRSFQVQQQQQPNVTRRLDGPDTGSSSSAGVGCRASFRPHSSSSSESVTFLV